ncbi:MAG: C25 family cysteine peptidase [Candidatus Sulfotelmatobacter sp.]
MTDCTRADWPTTDRTNTRPTEDRPKQDRPKENRPRGDRPAEDRPESKQFESFSLHCLQAGLRVRFQARGASMSPAIRDGEMVYVKPASQARLRRGDIVLVKSDYGFRLHRLVRADSRRNVFITRGDCGQQNDPAVRHDQIIGVAVAKDVRVGKRILRAKFRGIAGAFLQTAAHAQSIAGKLTRLMGLRRPKRAASPPASSRARSRKPERSSKLFGFLALLLMLFAAPYARAQVAVDAATSADAEETGNATRTLTFAHTTTATGTNLLMLVGVSINITNVTAAAVTGVTYNGTALTLLGTHNDAVNTRRVEIWYLLAPATGNNMVAVKINIPAMASVGVSAGAVTFTGVDQTTPLGSFVSADGAAAAYSQLNVPSVVNGMILDTLAIGGPETSTIPGPQVSEWNLTTANRFGGTADPPDVTGSGSTRTGAPSVPLSETFSANSNWSEGAVSINPTAADIGVTTTVGSAVFLGSNTTYTINVFNNGTSTANAVKLTDTLASGMTFVSATPSTGTCVTTANPIVCTIGNMASGANATVTVVETATAAGSYANTAVVSDTAPPPDPNTGNNTYVAVATVQSAACAGVSQAVPGTGLTGTLNTYYPGTASVAAGATSIPVGAATGTGSAIAAGNLLLIIQMQDAGINDSNTVAYGNGYTGQGFTNLNSAGDYEFVTAQSAVGTGGGTVTIAGAGAGGGTVFAYHAAAASATAGQSTYQVIVVPQYTTASFSAASPPVALAWNGSTGGVLAIDTSSTLTLNGATVSVSGQGFRGGAGMELTGGVGGNNTDYVHAAPAAYTGVAEAGVDAVKGEGIAGTPLWVESGGTYVQTTSDYPSGTAGTDGSSARGAPGNAGAGGTDGDPPANDQNAGGGGGANGGAGGFGGDSWNTNLSVGGEGGAAFPATINRIAMGGGGGAGTRNNSDGDNQASGGAAGGGIIIIRTYALSGTATLQANGVSAYNGTANDAGGGGGAGGSIVVLSANGGESGLTLQANGGNGGNAWATEAFTLANRHGPGGGGGGGVVLVSGTPASISVTGGTNGLTENPGVAYGATAGAAGTSVTNESITQTSGTQSGAQCTPDMTLTKSSSGMFTRGLTASYTIPVSNVSPYGSSNATVIVNDTLPIGLTPTTASGTGWSCSIVSQTVSCTDSTALAAGGTYPSITVTANVLQTAPSTVTNTAVVGGGGELNLANDTATNVATVVSSADLSVTNAASPNPVAAGSNITYTQIVTNSGPSAADTATFVQAVPANTTLVSISASAGWICSAPGVGSTGNVVCSTLSMTGGTAATFSMVVKVTAGTTSGTVIVDTATVSSSVSDPNSTNNTASAATVVGTTAQAEMTVTNSASPVPVIAGNNITYTQTATNVGSVAATNPTLTENTPANTTFQSISAPPGTTCMTPPVGMSGAISCTAPSAPAGSSGTVVLVVQVAAGTANGTVISDIVTVNATNQGLGANSATATDVVASATKVDLTLTTVGTPLSVFAGNNITYTETVTNSGPAAASAVSLTESIPNTTVVSASAPAGWTCATTATTVTCTDPSLASGASVNIGVVVNVAATDTATPIAATSMLSATNATTTSNTLNTPVTEACDLAVTNSGTPSPVAAGGVITYTQVVTNTGPSNCGTATFTEAFPTNTTFTSLTPVPTGWTCTTTGSISCTNPSVAPGSTSTFPVKFTVAAGATAGTLITDTATVATTTRDTNTANNSSTVIIAVASATQADLSVTNSASPNPVNAGQSITYSQSVTNAGPAAATTVVLTETLPANTTFVSLAGSGWTCTSAAPYTCSIASLAANATATFTFVVTVSATATPGSTITDTASVSSATGDPNSNNNSASATVYVAGSAALSVTNSASPVPVIAGNNITYAQVVTNAGPSSATAATFTENTPPNTTFVQLTPIPTGWSCTLPMAGAAGTITCTNPSFAVGTASFPVVVKVTAATPAGTAVNDTATVSSTTADPNPANNSATANDVVALATQADLITTNSAAPTSVAAGGNVTYTQSVTNNGPSAATAPTFTQTTPPNTNFQSITPPAGWTCTTPAVGAAGTITCTDGSSLALNATANFTLMLQVTSTTPSGTNIAETVTASATNIVPSLTTNSATANVVVANANSADMAIVKTATPSPTVSEGDPLTYSLAVTNNGPASATDVTVTDPLPSQVTFLSVTSTVGTCSQADGTVTCLLGTMANAATATITILTLPITEGTASNTATVTADQTDPVPANNSSTQTEYITYPTSIHLHSFVTRVIKDKTGANRTVLLWKTGGEAHNLGFNIYREQNGARVRLNSSLIAGSALLMSGSSLKHSAKSYAWIDSYKIDSSKIDSSPIDSSSASGSGSYWLEDVDVNGTRVLHGPVVASASSQSTEPAPATSLMLNQLNQSQPTAARNEMSHPVENIPQDSDPTPAQRQKQFELAANPAVKIYVKHDGWQSVTQPELISAGLDPNVDPAFLHLYAEAIEQPIQITGATAGPGGFGPQAMLQFYGTGIDTPYSGTRVYWLVAGGTPGQRIPQLPPSTGPNQPPASFPFAVELTQHTTYFAALITSNGNNFFGALISPTPTDQTLQVLHLDPNATATPILEVVLQGIILGFPHDVTVALNGTSLGDVTFSGQAKGKLRMSLPPGVLQEGANTITLTAQNGEFDTSLMQTIRITYPHSYIADSDRLRFTGRPGDELKVTGFTSAPVAVLDITNPAQPVALTPQISSNSAQTQYTLEVQVPWSANAWSANSASQSPHTLLAVAADRVASVAGISPNHPSHWHRAQSGSEIVMISHEPFTGALASLVQAHQAAGQSTAVVPVDDLYDEFTFGRHSPFAIKDFLYAATHVWHTAPHYLLLNGRASLDPRNYLGFGHLDFVPTMIVPTSMLMTASDDWFSDFTNTGTPTIATGRFPVSTPEEAELVAGRVATYEGQSSNGPWTSQALMVADVNDTENFTKDSQLVQAQLPAAMQATDVFASTVSIPTAQQDIITAINSGQLLVNYAGHGSEDEWSGDDLFNDTAASSLTNGSSLPVFLIMDCLNGFFQDVYEEPLAVALMLAPNGGAVAVLASSGLNPPAPQTQLDKLIVQNALHAPYPALGDAILQGKSAITDVGVRKTYNLLGDPAMQIKSPAPAH